MNKKLPCFLHIPRSGGTYLLYKSVDFLRLYGLRKGWNNRLYWNLDIRLLLVHIERKVIFTAVVYDRLQNYKNNKIFNPIAGPHSDLIEYEDFIRVCQDGQVLISSIVIESDGAHLIRSGFFDNFLGKLDLSPIYYCTLREPYNRAVSLYNYINSDFSAHEPTHKQIKSSSLEEYLHSYELEDSWVIRILTGIENNQEINEKIFEKTCQLLSTFSIKDVSKIDELSYEVFSKKFDDASDVLNKWKTQTDFYKNKSEKKEYPSFSDLKEDTKTFFLKRKKYDILLYNRFAFEINN